MDTPSDVILMLVTTGATLVTRIQQLKDALALSKASH
jgi:hypothetical protein